VNPGKTGAPSTVSAIGKLISLRQTVLGAPTDFPFDHRSVN